MDYEKILQELEDIKVQMTEADERGDYKKVDALWKEVCKLNHLMIEK